MSSGLLSPADKPAARSLRRWALLALAGGVLAAWLVQSPEGLLGKADAIGYAVCHRIDLRSFHLGDRPLPLCARCSGMYLGALFGFVFLAVRRRGRASAFPPWPVTLALAVFGLAFAVDGLNSYLHFFPGAPALYEPSNLLRLVTGTLLGLDLAVFVYAGFQQTAWRRVGPEPVLGSLAELGMLLAVGAGVVGLMLTDNPLILYPLALLSALSVVLVLTVVYAMLTLLVVRRENQAETLGQLGWPLLAGLVLAFVQIGLLDLGRYVITGSWEGFHL